MYRMVTLCGDIRRSLNEANKALAAAPSSDAVKKAEAAIDQAHSKLTILERECRAKEPA